MRSSATLAESIERLLFTRGLNVFFLDDPSEPHIATLLQAGLLVLTHQLADDPSVALAGSDPEPIRSPEDAVAYLKRHNILQREEIA